MQIDAQRVIAEFFQPNIAISDAFFVWMIYQWIDIDSAPDLNGLHHIFSAITKNNNGGEVIFGKRERKKGRNEKNTGHFCDLAMQGNNPEHKFCA